MPSPLDLTKQFNRLLPGPDAGRSANVITLMQRCVTLALFDFMARRLPSHKRRKYLIIWNDNLAGHIVSRDVFDKAIASGWIVEAEQGVARVVSGVKAALQNGALWLEDTARKAAVWIYTSWIAIDRNAPIIEGEYYRRELLRQYDPIKSYRPESVGEECRHGSQCAPWVRRMDWEAS